MSSETRPQSERDGERWTRVSTFTWTNWTLGVYWGSTPRCDVRGIDLGPLEVLWQRSRRRPPPRSRPAQLPKLPKPPQSS